MMQADLQEGKRERVKGNSYTLNTRLAILQQGEYEWRHYESWKRQNPGFEEEIKPKQWTLKISLLSLGATILGPLLGAENALKLCLFVLRVPQAVLTFFTVKSAVIKLRWLQFRGLKVIAVAGSYAKTSTKTILAHVLSSKYSVVSTPGNINRPIGIAREIFTNLTSQTKFFIVEMGEYDRGDIQFMTRMVNPQFAVITPITVAHLERFESIQEIEEEILDLARYSYAKVFSHEANINMFTNQSLEEEVSWYGPNNLKEVVVSRAGTEFGVEVGPDVVSVFIPLFGKHNAENTLPAILIGSELGLTQSEILQSLSSLPFVPHRLEPTLLENQILLLDNGYNSNPQSAVQALEVLRQLEGSQKVVSTPGFVELGEKQEEYNKELGRQIAKVADLCIVIESVNHDVLIEGLKEGGMSPKNILSASGEEEGMNKLAGRLQPSAIILFENSIPELYKKSF